MPESCQIASLWNVATMAGHGSIILMDPVQFGGGAWDVEINCRSRLKYIVKIDNAVKIQWSRKVYIYRSLVISVVKVISRTSQNYVICNG